jgi:hypothetical protein
MKTPLNPYENPKKTYATLLNPIKYNQKPYEKPFKKHTKPLSSLVLTQRLQRGSACDSKPEKPGLKSEANSLNKI